MPDVIVIRGGVIGACAAWQLAERGADVVLRRPTCPSSAIHA